MECSKVDTDSLTLQKVILACFSRYLLSPIHSMMCLELIKNVLRYLYRVHTRGGVSNVYTHLSAVAFHFRRQRRASPCDDQAVKMFMRGLKRLESTKVVKRAKPITLPMIKKAIHTLSDTSAMWEWRTVWNMAISFCCFLRWDDLKRVQVQDSISKMSTDDSTTN